MTTWDEVKDLKQGDEARVEIAPGAYVHGFIHAKDDAAQTITFRAIGRARPDEGNDTAVIDRTVKFASAEKAPE
jgi:hypothetical protein